MFPSERNIHITRIVLGGVKEPTSTDKYPLSGKLNLQLICFVVVVFTGKVAKDFFEKSKLPVVELSKIW